MTTSPAQLISRFQSAKFDAPIRSSRYSLQVKDEFAGRWIILPVRSGSVDLRPLQAAGGFDFALTEGN